MASSDLPSFERPPVVETVLGVQFDPLPDFANAHLGSFWKFMQDPGQGSTGLLDWPNVSDAPPLAPAHERFGEGETWRHLGAQLKLTQDVSARIQFRNTDGNRMIQLQNGRLHYNWVGHTGNPYPRYRVVRPEFDEVFGRFQKFLVAERLGECRPNQWEITYVNHLPKGSVWNEPSDWRNVFVSLPGPWSGPSAVRLESAGGEWHFEIVPQRGRLHIQLAHLRTGPSEPGETLRLMLTARGPVAEDTGEGLSLEEGLSLGREAIVRTFKDITSESAHEYWGLHNDSD